MTETRQTPAEAPADPVTRHTLDQATAENFPVAPFFLPRAWRHDLMALYGYARLVDDIGDGDLAPGGGDARLLGVPPEAADDRLALLDALEADLRRVFDPAPGGVPGPRHPLLRALRSPVRDRSLTIEPFLGLIAANRQDQLVRRYATYEELLAYCELSANPVGLLVLQVSGTLTPERLRRSNAVCTALQIVEHLQDVSEDLARDRIYLPAEDLRRFHVSENDLAAPTGNASVRALVAYQADRAHRLLDEGVPLVGSVHGRLRLLLAGFVGGGRAALAAIAAAGYDVLPGPPRPARTRLLHDVGAVLRRARKER
ncbi:squalene synthase HpnC [Streptomyces clavuligerus]|uniref:Phytoene synthase n=1 Tax=Streptomyces clavuligerus TaxID=1901 RepID=E2PZ44_STRCL|nr:squalene synthase HpnC [Streptomyces clavuligerus]ANW17228.1 squalene synthase HpnC [Streptomyces clavuligerus]AXU11768.1 squalene synthase HpnC [Streptomyces clavuligerus]EFG10305.1 Phytoene synthase [Streptomyces clavuligerus]MBY6301606.1 squalene synthase HpnC [Streptomyces clavuligerus]QCS04548.1 squalene synthase HpnC [Streptomyces clavuligerus]